MPCLPLGVVAPARRRDRCSTAFSGLHAARWPHGWSDVAAGFQTVSNVVLRLHDLARKSVLVKWPLSCLTAAPPPLPWGPPLPRLLLGPLTLRSTAGGRLHIKWSPDTYPCRGQVTSLRQSGHTCGMH